MSIRDRTASFIAGRRGGLFIKAPRAFRWSEEAMSKRARMSCAELESGAPGAEPEALPAVGEAYSLVRKLGEGAMAEVYEGVHRGLGRKVAIKLLHPDCASREVTRERFVREAQTLACIQSSHVVSVTDFGRSANGAPFLVMELLVGSDLRHLLERERRLPTARAVRLIQQACWGIAAAHAQRLIHRDLKPENLFVVQAAHGPEICKVIDFGVARRGDASRELTRDGALVGTIRYMAPEQARAQPIDERVDVYALGAILYELLSGSPPFAAQSDEVTLFQIMNEAPTALRTVCPQLPKELANVVERALEKDRELRFGSAEALAAALEPWVAQAQIKADVLGHDTQRALQQAPPASPAGSGMHATTRVEGDTQGDAVDRHRFGEHGTSTRQNQNVATAALTRARAGSSRRNTAWGLAWAISGGAVVALFGWAASVFTALPSDSVIGQSLGSTEAFSARGSGLNTKKAGSEGERVEPAQATSEPQPAAGISAPEDSLSSRRVVDATEPELRAVNRARSRVLPRPQPVASSPNAAHSEPASASAESPATQPSVEDRKASPAPAQDYILENPYALSP